jgi:hypothetical protein
LFEAGNTVVRAFIEAGIFALAAIALLLWVTLRRTSDVLLTLVPLLVAIVVTLELAVALEIPLNFANIIALPLLLGVGVAFKIYYIMAWRSGKTGLVQSTLTRAVMFSAMTQAAAFGSLWLSSDPGTSSMGKLMALSLLCTMAAAVLFQPALMGRPRARAVPLEPVFKPAPQFEFGEDQGYRRARPRMNWSINAYHGSSRPDETPSQFGSRQSAGVCHPSRTFVSFRFGVPGFPACRTIFVRRPSLPLARLSCGRSRALVRLRPVLCVAGRLPDVAVLFPLRPLRLAEPRAQGSPDICP